MTPRVHLHCNSSRRRVFRPAPTPLGWIAIFVLLVFPLMLTSVAHAQAIYGSIGGTVIDPSAAARLVQALAEGSAPRAADADRLTRRERDVLELIAGGRSNKRIALELGISEKTVKSHVGHVLAKLGVSDRTQAALLAVRDGLVGRRS